MKPILLFAFANDADRPLDSLAIERKLIQEKLLDAAVEELCEVRVIEPANIDSILEAFQKYPDRIAVFHYAGHANDYQLCLEQSDGSAEIAHAGGFAEFLALQRGLQLIFLNGCSTQAQVEDLLQARIGGVIATSKAISDKVATQFSANFYHSLGSGDGIQKAFEEAAAAVKMRVGTGEQHRGLFYDEPTEYADRFPWDFYVSDGSDIIREWNLPGASGNPLFGLPKPPQIPLPERPFRYLRWFHPEDAEVFFGRAYQIRELYDKIADPNMPFVIHLYGRSGVGKSSLLAAGLLPRLQSDHEVLYLRRSQQSGVLPVLANALQTSEEPTAIRTAWQHREQQQQKPLTVILDQIEEIYTRPLMGATNDLPDAESDELGALLEVVLQLQAPGTAIQGKLIFSYRKEYLAEIENRFLQARIAYDKLFLENLRHNDILAAISGLTKSPRTRDKYHLEIEPGLPTIITDDLLEDRDSPIAPVLQILLSKMWDETPLQNGARTFTTDTYQQLKREGLLLGDFLDQKLDELREWNAQVVDSGLVLGLLLFHTTPKGTAARRGLDEIEARYPQHSALLPSLLTELKNRYLLVEVSNSKNGGGRALSLAHDTLAPLLREMSLTSDYPGQKAHRILTNKIADWKAGDIGNALDSIDLAAVEEGQWGMRAWTKEEQQLVEASRERRARRRRTRRRVIAGGIGMLVLIIGASIVAWIFQGMAKREAANAALQAERAEKQALLATSNSLSATSILEKETSPTTAFRLAEYALAYDSTNARAYSALLQAYYQSPYFFDGQWYASPFFLEASRESVPALYPYSEYVLYPTKPGADYEASYQEVQALQTRLNALFGDNGPAAETEFVYIEKAVFSPSKKYVLLAFESQSDFSVPSVEVWPINGNEPIYKAFLSYSQMDQDYFTTANFSFDDRYVAVPQENRVVLIDLEQYNSRFAPEQQAEASVQFGSSTAEVLQTYFSREDYLISSVDARGETHTWNLRPSMITTIGYNYDTDILTDRLGRYIIQATGQQATVWSVAGERLGSGKVSANQTMLSEGPNGIADLPLVTLMKHEWYGGHSLSSGRDTSADGRLSITASKYNSEYDYFEFGQIAYILNAEGDTLLALSGHSRAISDVAISPNNDYFLTTTCPKGESPESTLWDSDGNIVFTLADFGGKAGFLPSGDAIFTYLEQCCAECDYGDEIRVWPINARYLIDLADRHGVHHLNLAERTRYGIDTSFLPVPSAGPVEEKKVEAPLPQAYITGSGVNVRSAPEVGQNVVGQLNKGIRVDILAVQTPEGSGDRFVTKLPTQLRFEDGSEQTLDGGRAMKRLRTLEGGMRYEVQLEVEGTTLTGSVSAADLEAMSGIPWYQVRTNQLTGWVYGSFVEEI